MTERTKTKELIPQIEEIKEKAAEFEKLIAALPNSYVKDKFMYSVENINKKLEEFLTPVVKLTPEERRIAREAAEKALAEFRAQKESEVLPISEDGAVSDDKKTRKSSKNK